MSKIIKAKPLELKNTPSVKDLTNEKAAITSGGWIRFKQSTRRSWWS
jgi:hypothetical protein